jgi:ribonucleoside-diphosphate reductase alpha chain
VNLPYEATKDDVSLVFKNLYKSGCKGGTVYRDGSRKEQVLLRQTESEKQSSASGVSVRKLPYKRQGATVSMKTPSGTAHITMNHDSYGQPFEVFIEIGKAGSSVLAMAEAIGRLISLIFRLKEISPMERAKEIIEQLNGIGGAHSVGFGKNKVLSLPDAVSKALAEHYELPLIKDVTVSPNNLSADICPVCGQSSFIREEGCVHCLSCGFSEC